MRRCLLKSLRIAVTAASLLVCGLLVVFWVRSYYRWEYIDNYILRSPRIIFHSRQGVVDFYLLRSSTNPSSERRWKSTPSDEKFPNYVSWDFKAPNQYWFFLSSAPHWFYLTIFAAIAALPWIKWRFSLRTLLIVFTLFALFFGAIAISMSS